MFRSFKLKMAAFSLCTSGAILLAFASLFMSVVRRAGLERVDSHLRALAEGQMRRDAPPGHWFRFGESLSAVYGENDRQRFLVKVIANGGTPLYTSAYWPSALTGAGLVLPDSEKMPPDTAAPMPPPPLPRPLRRGDRPDEPDGPDGPRPMRPPRLAPPKFLTLHADGRNWRFAVLRNPSVTLLVGTDLAELQTELKRFRTAFAVAGPIGLLLLAAGGWLLAGQALRPVRILTRVAGGMTAKGLGQRVQAPGADHEFQALIDVINGMLERLEKSFGQAARFSADAAHELKTPLTILQGQLDQTLHNAPVGSDAQRAAADLLEEVQRLKSIVRKLLLLAQSDSGQLRLSLERVDLTQELESLCGDTALMAPGLALHKDFAPAVCLMADPDLLRQILHNLFSNAVKYNREDGIIECRLRQEAQTVTFCLANTIVPGLQLERNRLFDRFYRGDPSRNRRVDGSGLGLSLAREISRAHGGDLVVETGETREGWISFRLTLPCGG